MKKLLLLTKTLLAAALLCVGQNAWGTDAFVQNFSGSSTDPADYGFVVSTSGSSTATVGDGKLTLSAEANAGSDRSAAVTATFSAIGTGNIVTFSCAWNPGGPTGTRAASNLVLQDGSGTAAMTLSNDGQNKKLYLNGSEIASGDDWRSSAIVWNVVATLNITTNKILTLTVTKSGDSDPTVSESNIAFQNSVSSISKFYCQTTKKANWVCTSTLDDVSITYEASSTPTVDYTINYKLGDDVVKTVNSSDDDGVTIYAETAVDGVGTFAGNHYLITANSAPSITLDKDAAENVLDVSVRAPYTATLNVTRTIGGVAQSPVVTNLVETDAKVCSWTYTYPLYVQKDGVYYVADVTSSFGESGTFTNGETINKTVAYTNPDYSVVYFGEPNEVTGTNTTYSNGATGFITGGVVYSDNRVIRLGQLKAGTYRLIVNVTGDANRNLVVGDYTAGTASFPTALVTITTTGAKDESFTVDGTQLISISGKDQGSGKFNQSATVDYILVKASSASATIGAKGYTTFSSSYPLNLAGISGGTAYKVITSDIAGTVVTPSAASGTIAAGEGLLLSGEAGATVTIPVAASGDAITGNLMVGCPTGATITSETANYNRFYVLVNGETEAKFANLTDWVEDENTVNIPANKAYLYIPSVSARSMSIVLGDKVTGVDNVEAAAEAKAKEGKFIENGKLVIVKNGQKFNAAGAKLY